MPAGIMFITLKKVPHTLQVELLVFVDILLMQPKLLSKQIRFLGSSILRTEYKYGIDCT